MPTETKFDVTAGCIHHLLTGEILADEIISAFDASKTLPEVQADTPVIWEFRNATLPQLSNIVPSVKEIADYIGQNQEIERREYRAALVAESDLLYGVSRMYQAIAEFLPVEFKVFRTKDKALEWIT